nr:MFS transporter [Oceanicaulis sp. MMSF_3324]
MTTQTEAQPGAAPTPTSTRYSAWVLAMLFIVYAFNFLDRQIISILAIPIQQELGLSDRQLGLLGGIAFALLYSTLGVPIAWLADRTKRTWIITISLTIWSGFTAICGLATNFTQLFLARVGVGVGEAGGVAPSYSLIADYFPPQSRARALAIYSLGIPIGSAFGVVAGALIAGGAVGENLDWRAAFIIVGVLGLVIAPIFKFTVREPKRGGLDAPQRPAVEAELAENEAAAGEPAVVNSMEAKEQVALRPSPLASILTVIKKVITFTGRARRSEFWWAYALLSVSQLALIAIALFVPDFKAVSTVFMALNLLLISVAVRRFHDVGMSGFWLLIPLFLLGGVGFGLVTGALAVVARILAFVFVVVILARPSVEDNSHGPNPVPSNYFDLLRAKPSPSFADVLAVLISKPSFWWMTLGASCSSMMGYGVFFWVPSFFRRSFFSDLGLQDAIIQSGWLFGAILFVGGSLGIILGGVLGDLMGKGSKRMYAIVPAVAFFVTYPFYIAGVLAPTPLVAVLMFMIPTGLGLAWLGPTLSAFQHMAPPNMRSMASAIFLLINNLVGIGVGVYALGELSTLLTPSFGEEALRYSIMIGATLYLVAGALFLIGARTIAKDWEEA